MSRKDDVLSAYEREFGQKATVVIRAPGRVNLIGDHTDYNDGFVLPMAIDREVWLAAGPREDTQVVVRSLDLPDATAVFDASALMPGDGGWIEYVKGTAWALAEAGYPLHGFRAVLKSDVPIGAGLSSSAALELAVARTFLAIAGTDASPADIARLTQRAESEWVGNRCGIMDQLISASGRAGHAVLIDCRSLACEPVPLPAKTVVVVLDTSTRRGLVDSAYNDRRAQCESAAQALGVAALRDVSPEMLRAHAHELPEVVARRARHVVSENARTVSAAEAMKRGDAATVGALMNESHTSLRDDFEVSSRELDSIAEKARAHAACYGARMTGAGFGGCAVALVRADGAEAFVRDVSAGYAADTGKEAQVYVCTATDGAQVVPL